MIPDFQEYEWDSWSYPIVHLTYWLARWEAEWLRQVEWKESLDLFQHRMELKMAGLRLFRDMENAARAARD